MAPSPVPQLLRPFTEPRAEPSPIADNFGTRQLREAGCNQWRIDPVQFGHDLPPGVQAGPANSEAGPVALRRPFDTLTPRVSSAVAAGEAGLPFRTTASARRRK